MLLVGRAKEDFIMSLQLVNEELGMIVKNVKIDKIAFVKKIHTKRMVTLSGGMPPKLSRR